MRKDLDLIQFDVIQLEGDNLTISYIQNGLFHCITVSYSVGEYDYDAYCYNIEIIINNAECWDDDSEDRVSSIIEVTEELTHWLRDSIQSLINENDFLHEQFQREYNEINWEDYGI